MKVHEPMSVLSEEPSESGRLIEGEVKYLGWFGKIDGQAVDFNFRLRTILLFDLLREAFESSLAETKSSSLK